MVHLVIHKSKLLFLVIKYPLSLASAHIGVHLDRIPYILYNPVPLYDYLHFIITAQSGGKS